MIPFAVAITYIPTLITAFKALSHFATPSEIAKASIKTAAVVAAYQSDIGQFIKDGEDEEMAHVSNLVQDAPVIDDSINITTSSPTTMPDYLAQQNELAHAQIEKTNSLIAQTKYQSDLLSKSIESQITLNSNVRLMSETISQALPAMVIQLQEIAKIPSVLSLKTDTETSYAELALANHEELISTLQALDLTATFEGVNVELTSQSDPSALEALATLSNATNSQTAELQKVATNLNSVSSNATAQQKVAEHLTTRAIVRRLDGTVVAELTPQELSTYKDVSLMEAKTKEKEIADYQTTPQAIKNLDGNTVATMKPMEAVTAKSIVDAKNATDEMEFELDDDILDDVFKPFSLPTYTTNDVVADDKKIYLDWVNPNTLTGV